MADTGWRRNKYGGWFNINDTTNDYMNRIIRNKSRKFEANKEKFVDSKGQSSSFKKVNGKTFKKELDKAKKTQPDDDKWRVDNESHSAKEYDDMKTFVTENGSTVAITNEGDIVSVCGSYRKDKGRTLLEYAVQNGGVKLDSYEGNWEVYTHCGFEPISWCKFEEKYAPSDWRKGKDNPEAIVFFKYSGKPEHIKITTKEFYKSTKPSKDYNEAMEKRDKEVKK